MKTFVSYLILAVAAMTLLSGCAPAIQAGVALSGSLAASIHEAKKGTEQKGVFKKQAIPIQINELIGEVSISNNIVKINHGWYKESLSVVFSAVNNQGELIERVFIPVPTEKYSDEIRRIKTMSEKEKRDYVRNIFLARNIDLGPVEPDTAEKSPVSAPSSPPDIPLPGFAPAPPQPKPR